MNRIVLHENHLRALSASLRIVEEYLGEMEYELKNPTSGCLKKIDADIPEKTRNEILQKIEHIKSFLRELVAKYGLKYQNHILSRFIDAHKSSIWVILSDTKSGRLKGYGNLSKEYAKELDEDIESLQHLVALI